MNHNARTRSTGADCDPALQRLVTNAFEAATLGAAGRKCICEEFSVESMVAAGEELSVGLLAGR